jgi:antitoxin component of MazEF toxin-antitoxin module
MYIFKIKGVSIMLKTLARHGNSMALVIEKPILELIGAQPETIFDITTDGNSLIVTPVKTKKQSKKIIAEAEKIKQKYYDVLKKLAE